MKDKDLQDLVDYPSETLGVELKSWIDFEDRVARAKLARHIAALANFGGGYIVFGFDDDGGVAKSRPASLDEYNRDTIASIVKKYLVPPLHCDVSMVGAEAGLEYPVIRVPSHGAEPICSKSSGPHDGNGNPQGIEAGRYYLRLPGPESAQITSPEQWRGVIRRCVLNERDFVTKVLSDLVEPSGSVDIEEDHSLQVFHDATQERFQDIVQQGEPVEWPVSLGDNHYQLSYRIVTTGSAELDANKLFSALDRANANVRSIVWTGWSMFYTFSGPELRPVVEPDSINGKEVDVLVTNLIKQEWSDITLPDYWRMTSTGLASLVRGYREDRRQETAEQRLFTPFGLARELTEFLGHATIMAKNFPGATSIEFVGTWRGLSGRVLSGSNGPWDYSGERAAADERTVRRNWPVSQLTAQWVEIVTELANKVLILFDRYQLNEEVVNSMSSRFRSL